MMMYFAVKMRSPGTLSNVKKKLATSASGRLRNLFKIGQPLKSNFVLSEVA